MALVAEGMHHAVAPEDPVAGAAGPTIGLLTIIELIAATKTKAGLTLQAAYDPTWHPTGEKITDDTYATPSRLL